MVVQERGEPDEFDHKPTLAAGRPAIVRRTAGSKKIRMVYAPTGRLTDGARDGAPAALVCLNDGTGLRN